MIIFSIITVGVVFYMLYVLVDILFNSYVKPIAVGSANDEQTENVTVVEETVEIKKPDSKKNGKTKKDKGV